MNTLLDDASTLVMPANWADGFQNSDYAIAAGGTERPFYQDGAWKISVFEKATGVHLLYNYSTELLEVDPVRDES